MPSGERGFVFEHGGTNFRFNHPFINLHPGVGQDHLRGRRDDPGGEDPVSGPVAWMPDVHHEDVARLRLFLRKSLRLEAAVI